MFKQTSHTLPTKKVTTKIIAGFAGLAATAVIAASGFAFAAPADKPTKQQCQQAGFSNYGQCVKEWAKDKNHPGTGYGGSNTNTVDIGTNVDVSIDNGGGSNNRNAINVMTDIVVSIFN